MGVSRQEYWSGVPLPSPDLVAAHLKKDFPVGTGGGSLPASAGDMGLILGPGRFHML